MSYIRDFRKDLRIPQEERKFNQRIVSEIFEVKSFDHVELGGRKKPNDYEMETIDGKKQIIEFKNYRSGNSNPNIICLEQKTDVERDTKGWTFYIKADFVIFVWTGKSKLCYLCVKGKELTEWWIKNHNNYNEIKNYPTVDKITQDVWQSSYSRVPVSDVPEEIVVVRELQVDLNDFMLSRERYKKS